MWIKSKYDKNVPVNLDNITFPKCFGKDGGLLGIGFMAFGDKRAVAWTYETEKERDDEYNYLLHRLKNCTDKEYFLEL